MQRVKAVISYDGSNYLGFQKQKSTHHTITHVIEKALHSLQINSDIVASGRTDRGVHATGQVIHFDLPSFWKDTEKLKIALNHKLTDISFKHITKVPNNFHARFSAKKRLYRYIFKTKPTSVFEKNYISHYSYNEIDSIRIKEALQCFEGVHDFKYFHKTGSITHTNIREIFKTTHISKGDYHVIYFQANGFLRSQVRMMVDAAILYSVGKIALNALQRQLKVEEQYTHRLAPPEGLYLAKITY